MNARIRFHITAALLCHLLIPLILLTTRLQAQQAGEPIQFQAREQERKGNLYVLRGDVQVDFRTYTLTADEISYDADTKLLTVTGNVVFDGGPHDEHLTATHGTYNVDTDSGRF